MKQDHQLISALQDHCTDARVGAELATGTVCISLVVEAQTPVMGAVVALGVGHPRGTVASAT